MLICRNLRKVDEKTCLQIKKTWFKKWKNKNMQKQGNPSTCFFATKNNFKRNLREQKSNCFNRKRARIESDEIQKTQVFFQISSFLIFAMFLVMIVCRFLGGDGDGSSLFFGWGCFSDIFLDIFSFVGKCRLNTCLVEIFPHFFLAENVSSEFGRIFARQIVWTIFGGEIFFS